MWPKPNGLLRPTLSSTVAEKWVSIAHYCTFSTEMKGQRISFIGQTMSMSCQTSHIDDTSIGSRLMFVPNLPEKSCTVFPSRGLNHLFILNPRHPGLKATLHPFTFFAVNWTCPVQGRSSRLSMRQNSCNNLTITYEASVRAFERPAHLRWSSSQHLLL